MAAAGGARAAARVGAYVTWQERDAIQAARVYASAQAGRPLSLADFWTAEATALLEAGSADEGVPEDVRRRCVAALAALRAQVPMGRAPGRRPQVY